MFFLSSDFIYTEVSLDQPEAFPHGMPEIKMWGREAVFFLVLHQKKGCLGGDHNLQF